MNRHSAGSDSSIPEEEKSTTPVLFSDSEESDNVHTEDKKSVPSITTIISVSSDELPRSLRNAADTSMDVQIDCDKQRDITDASISDSTLFTGTIAASRGGVGCWPLPHLSFKLYVGCQTNHSPFFTYLLSTMKFYHS